MPFRKKEKQLNERMQVGWIAKGKVLQGKAAKVLCYSTFIYYIYIFFCQAWCSTVVEWCILSSPGVKEPRHHGNRVLSTVKEVQTYNGNISISTNSRHGFTFALILGRESWEKESKNDVRSWKRRRWKVPKRLITKENELRKNKSFHFGKRSSSSGATGFKQIC